MSQLLEHIGFLAILSASLHCLAGVKKETKFRDEKKALDAKVHPTVHRNCFLCLGGGFLTSSLIVDFKPIEGQFSTYVQSYGRNICEIFLLMTLCRRIDLGDGDPVDRLDPGVDSLGIMVIVSAI